MKLILILTIVAVTIANSVKIDTKLQKVLKNNETANIFVSFENGTSKALNSATSQSYNTRGDKINAIVKALTQNAQNSQVNVLSFLHQNQIKAEQFKSFWISNQIYIKNANLNIVNALTSFAEVSEILLEPILEMERPQPGVHIPKLPKELTWGLAKIQAADVWNMDGGNSGGGVLVGAIDSGVRLTHEALVHNYVGEYGWYDPLEFTELPIDGDGHGTHVMGTMVGGNGIGVAPGAQWMACLGCPLLCFLSSLVECGQFMLCPTLHDGSSPDCSKAPHVVSNSWGTEPSQTFFHSALEAWDAAGIVPVFSNANAGPECKTTAYPGGHELAISVGNTDINDTLHITSSRGPAITRIIKPDVSAPGTNVYSAIHSSDTAYDTYTGTSMSSPHAAGVVALLLSRNLTLSNEEVRYYLTYGNEQNLIKPGQNCGDVSEDQYPNNAFGHGRINAFNSVSKLIEDGK